jgi:hypothetical protein
MYDFHPCTDGLVSFALSSSSVTVAELALAHPEWRATGEAKPFCLLAIDWNQ